MPVPRVAARARRWLPERVAQQPRGAWALEAHGAPHFEPTPRIRTRVLRRGAGTLAPMPRVAGVDGCKKGWVVVVREPGGGMPEVRIEERLDAVLSDPSFSVIAIDIPIGLLDAAVPGGRECERQARAFLSPRGSSVFSAPVRACLDADGHPDASGRSRRSSPHELGISAQCWGITPKIREVDRLITPAMQDRVIEVHPEVSFAAMNGDKPLGHGKKTREGRMERAALLAAQWNCDVLPLALERRTGAKPDDVLDAMAAAWTAERVAQRSEQRMPVSPAVDGRGLRMEIVR
jgi:predicted RNase H-like nuclease